MEESEGVSERRSRCISEGEKLPVRCSRAWENVSRARVTHRAGSEWVVGGVGWSRAGVHCAYFRVHSRAVSSYFLRSVSKRRAISGTSGSSGFGSVSSEQTDSSTIQHTTTHTHIYIEPLAQWHSGTVKSYSGAGTTLDYIRILRIQSIWVTN